MAEPPVIRQLARYPHKGHAFNQSKIEIQSAFVESIGEASRMGWIRKHMEALTPPVNSFSKLAQRVCKARAWPPEEKLKPNSLATYLRRLDEGRELEQFEQRPGILQALAEALEMTAEDMEEQLAQLRSSKPEKNPWLKLHDMPVRRIDLRTDPPPPGLPWQVMAPEQWPLWWYAPSGSGRSLAGRWLEARKLARFIQAPTWADAERKFPQEGAVFIELGSTEGVPAHDQLPSRVKICVATEAYPPRLQSPQRPVFLLGPRGLESALRSQQQPEDRSWPVVESPPVDAWLRPLLEWLRERATGVGFDTAACLKWLGETSVLSQGDDLGTVLGLIGLFATYAQKPGAAGPLYRAKDLGDMVRLFVRMRRQQVEEAALPADVLHERLRALGKRLLLEGDGSWAEARPLDAWHALARTQPDDTDIEWLGELRAKGLQMDPSSLDAARSSLPPNAFRTVRGLRELGLLREREPQQYVLRPSWVLQGILEQAIRESIDKEGPGTWGTILVRQAGAAVAMHHLLDRCRQGDFSAIEKIVAAPDTSSPAWAAALEASFRILGLTILEGKQVPEALHRDVLRLQRRLLIPSYDGAPQPRLAYSHQLMEEHFLLGENVWYTALLVLAEPLPPGDELSLEPWCSKLSPETVKWMVDMVSMGRKDDEGWPEPWKMPLLLLGARLLDRLKLPANYGPVSQIVQPEKLLRLLQQENPSLKDLEELVPWGALAMDMPEYARRRGVEWKSLARKVWAQWFATESKQLPNFLAPNHDSAAIFWRELPPEAVGLFTERNLRWILKQGKIYSFFQKEHWDTFVHAWISLKESWWGDAPRPAWHFIPPEHVRRALRAGLPDGWDHETRRTLWERLPEVFCEEIDSLLKQGQWDHALVQAWAVPPSLFLRVLGSVEAVLAQEGVPPSQALCRWLRDQIRNRVPGWERAWRLLEQLAPTTGLS
jgi:hypothetical protein